MENKFKRVIKEDLLTFPGSELNISLQVSFTELFDKYNTLKTSDFLVVKYKKKDWSWKDEISCFISYFEINKLVRESINFYEKANSSFKMVENKLEVINRERLVINFKNGTIAFAFGMDQDPTKDTSNAESPCVNFYINETDNFIKMSLEHFEGFVNFIERFDLYSASKLLVNTYAVGKLVPLTKVNTNSGMRRKKVNSEEDDSEN